MNSPQAAGNGRHRGALPVPSVREGVLLCPVLSRVYALAQKMMPEYEGGFWHFIRLPDGGGYMMPDGDRFHLVNGENWFDRTVSADAAGIIVTSLVINRQLWLYHDSGDAGLTHLYRMRDAQLWSHIEFHPECNAIYAALD